MNYVTITNAVIIIIQKENFQTPTKKYDAHIWTNV